MPSSAFVSVGAIISLVGAMTTPSASDGTSESLDEDSAPALVLPLTTALGEPTEVATSALGSSAVGGGGSSVRPTSGTSLSLLGADGDVLDPAEDAAILTEPLEVDPFFVTGLTWEGGSELPDGTDVYIRVREGEDWSQWYLTDPEVSQRDDGVGKAGTEPFVTGGADGVQVRVTGAPEDLPENLALTMLPSNPDGEQVLDDSDVTEVAATATAVNGGSLEGADDTTLSQLSPSTSVDTSKSPDGEDEQSGESGVTTQSGGVQAPGTGTGTGNSVASSALSSVFPTSTTATDLPVSVSSRVDWGADESKMTWDPTYASASFVVVHHTAGTNNYTMDQSASVVRGIYQYHAVQLGWGDIGYNFLVDKWGRAFEGRAGSLASPTGKMVVGAHDLGFNTGTMGISMIGDYSTVTPSSATLDTVGKLAGWQLARADVSATGSGSFTPTISNGTLVAGRTVTVNRISGHRDTYATACPGNAGYAKLADIRRIAAATAEDLSSPSVPGKGNASPQGRIETVSADTNTQTITAAGWAFDTDTTSPITVRVYLDGTPRTVTANTSRPDVNKAFGLGRDQAGFSTSIPTTPGTHSVCVWAMNVQGGSNKLLGCKNTTLAPKSTTGFSAGYIMSDAVFFAKTALSASQVQQFLTSKNSGCQSNADGTACLKDYRTTSKSMTYPYCNTYAPATNETAAQVISKVATACGINPGVLIVMLQKEQGLVTATGSSLTRAMYDKAMGLQCPDTAACDPAHSGFAPQVYGAASRLVQYGEQPQSFTYRQGQTAMIAYNPSSACGSAPVTILNRATAALYNYTPYQPNAAALANLYGTGDSCSTYGNRNLWRLYRDWFGSPT